MGSPENFNTEAEEITLTIIEKTSHLILGLSHKIHACEGNMCLQSEVNFSKWEVSIRIFVFKDNSYADMDE